MTSRHPKNTSNHTCRNCIYSTKSTTYNSQINRYTANSNSQTNTNQSLNAKIAFHFLAPIGSFLKTKVNDRAIDIVQSLNDDFNNYSNNPNTMNNFKYKNVVNRVFLNNQDKQNIYLGQKYISTIPTIPSNLSFNLGKIYYYPVTTQLNLSNLDDINDTDLEIIAIKQFITQNGAAAINPNNFINIWVIDMIGTSIMGLSSFPWENIDDYTGIIVNRKAFFPEDYGETSYNLYKTFTHEMGHFFGLLHTFENLNSVSSNNINLKNYDGPIVLIGNESATGDLIEDTPEEFQPTMDPTIPTLSLQTDPAYNPLFMNFMDYTFDRYLSNFTQDQIFRMKNMITRFRTSLNNNVDLPAPIYNPETNTLSGFTKVNINPLANRPKKTNSNKSSILNLSEPVANNNKIVINKTGPPTRTMIL